MGRTRPESPRSTSSISSIGRRIDETSSGGRPHAFTAAAARAGAHWSDRDLPPGWTLARPETVEVWAPAVRRVVERAREDWWL